MLHIMYAIIEPTMLYGFETVNVCCVDQGLSSFCSFWLFKHFQGPFSQMNEKKQQNMVFKGESNLDCMC